MSFPMTQIGGIPISRLTIGTNWFVGASHFSAAKDRWIQRYQTRERVVEVLSVCSAAGLNGIVSGPGELVREALAAHEQQTGRHIYWFMTPMGDDLPEMLRAVEQCAEWGAEFCLPHSCFTDGRLNVAESRIEGLEPVLAEIRRLGMIPGLSTHRPETIVIGDRRGYDVETYIQPFNALGFLCAVETDWVTRVINDTPKPVICIKPLAAGRIMPPTGLSFCYQALKPVDTVCIGLLSPEEAEEDIDLARSLLAGQGPHVPLSFSRSKAHLRPQETEA